MSEPNSSKKVIRIGSTVTYVNSSGEKFTFTISDREIDLLRNIISVCSPFAKAVLGKRTGEETTVKAPRGDYKIKILNISLGKL
jgi:transcription elongation GreA/GreB family factor